MFTEDLQLYKLTNAAKTTLEILNLGATIFSLKIKDAEGNLINVVVGPKNKEDYVNEEYRQKNMCFGASIGRYAGRISEGEFILDGKALKLFQKNGVHLHGGKKGLQQKVWDMISQTKGANPSIRLSCSSKDGEEGYPGNLNVEVFYTLTEENELKIEYTAKSDKQTIINLTNHTYFNLNGEGSVKDHKLQINAPKILEVDSKLRPTGVIRDLISEEKDFLVSKRIKNINVDDTYVLNQHNNIAARIYSSKSKIEMILKTNQSAVVTFIPVQLPDHWEYNTKISKKFPSFCLEAQNFPDAPNHSNFPSSILNAGETYLNKISYKFNLVKD
ncbi:aldose epimerase family protein [Gillisia sp. JM1]|uniref:aldose epimerase family protein n=1 Tax=Gillisia sp. JM1 TaxID=1283286 RepID=UPI000403EA99|nr:aldose epimerase family protein [Gillisia sp. JM1]